MMTKTEIAQLLTLAASYDNRKLGPEHVEAWALLLADLDYEDAVEALKNHYRTSDKWMMPAHVVQGVKALEADRERRRSRIPAIAPTKPAQDPALVKAAVDRLFASRDNQRVRRRVDPARKAAAERELERLRSGDD